MTEPSKALGFGGTVIRELRIAANLSQTELVDLLGGNWDVSRVSRVENGKLTMSRPVVREMAKALEIGEVQLYLKCLKTEYPQLKSSVAGALLDELVNSLNKGK